MESDYINSRSIVAVVEFIIAFCLALGWLTLVVTSFRKVDDPREDIKSYFNNGIENLRHEFNSRVTELVATAKGQGHAEGFTAGEKSERDRRDS